MSVPAIAMDQHNPVTPGELQQAITAAEQEAVKTAIGGYLSPAIHLATLLAAVPGGPIPAEHPAALPLVSLLCKKYAFDTPRLVEDHVQALRDALNGWPGDWRPLLQKVAHGRYCAAFRAKYDDSKPRAKAPPLVHGLVLDAQPCIIGGVFKSMKTTLACDLAGALVTGHPFLDKTVECNAPVLYLTAERSAHSVRAMIETSATRREPDRTKWANLTVTSKNMIGTEGGRQVLAELIRQGGARVVFFDPLYLLIGEVNQSDLLAMGARLRKLCEAVIESRGTPILLHHALKDTPTGEYVGLKDLAGAGVAEFARSWLLLNRAAEYVGGKVHHLLAVAGTSEGDNTRMRIRLDETTMEATAAEPPGMVAEPSDTAAKPPAPNTWQGRRPV